MMGTYDDAARTAEDVIFIRFLVCNDYWSHTSWNVEVTVLRSWKSISQTSVGLLLPFSILKVLNVGV